MNADRRRVAAATVVMAIAAFAAVVCVVAAQFAQAGANPYDGRWRAQFSDADERERRGRVDVDGTHGTWRFDVSGARGTEICASANAPIEIRQATRHALVFVIRASAVQPGCNDATVALAWLDERTLRGSFGGRELTLVRE